MTLPQNHLATSFAAPGKIVVSTDLTDTEYLLPHAIAQAKASGASLILVHAVLPHESVPMESLVHSLPVELIVPEPKFPTTSVAMPPKFNVP